MAHYDFCELGHRTDTKLVAIYCKAIDNITQIRVTENNVVIGCVNQTLKHQKRGKCAYQQGCILGLHIQKQNSTHQKQLTLNVAVEGVKVEQKL